jgi:hypothetical protein
MFETTGTVTLKIDRLKQHLKVLEQQQKLSWPYPQHKQNLIRESSKVRTQLYLLRQYQDELLQQVTR